MTTDALVMAVDTKVSQVADICDINIYIKLRYIIYANATIIDVHLYMFPIHVLILLH